MTIKELVYDLWTMVRASHIVDDDSLDERQFIFWINTQRALWLKRNIDGNNYIDENLIQTINAQLELIDPANDVTFSYGYGRNTGSKSFTSDVKVLRTINELPIPIEIAYNNGIIGTYSPDLLPFNHVHFNQFLYSGSGKFNNREVFTTLKNKKLYVKYGGNNLSPNTMKTVVVRGVFQNPLDVEGFNPDTDNYPVNMHIVDFMKDMIVKNNLRFYINGADLTNNSGDNTLQESK